MLHFRVRTQKYAVLDLFFVVVRAGFKPATRFVKYAFLDLSFCGN